MATLNIGGQRVKVGDEFLQLSPEQQSATVEEIASSLKPATAERLIPSAIRDIPKEISASFNENLDAAKQGLLPTGQGQRGVVENLLNTGKGILAIPGMAMAPITGAARSLIGHPLAAVEDYGRELNSMPADPEGSYARAKGDVDLAMTAARPAGVPVKAPGPLGSGPAYRWQEPTAPPPPVPTEGAEVALAAQRLSQTGIPVQVPRAVTTDSMATQRAAATARNIPLAGDPLVKAADRTLGQLGTKAEEAASGFGGGTVQGAGDAARTSIKDWITGESADTSTKFYNRVDALIDPVVTTDLQNTRAAAQSIISRRANAAISDDSGAVKRIEEAITTPGGLNYEGIKDLRGYVRELQSNPSVLPADISGKELSKIYDGLTADLKASVQNAGGPQASVAFERANKHYALVSQRREDLAQIIGEDASAPAERVFDRLVGMASSSSRADISKLAQARKAIGVTDWNEFASGVVSRLGRNSEGDFSPNLFVRDYGKLSDAGKTMLFRSGGRGDLAQHLDDIAKVSSRYKELQKFSNPSGTGQALFGGGIGAGMLAHPLTTASLVLGGRTVAYALSRPASAASLAKYSQAQLNLARRPSPPNLAGFSIAARNLLSTLGDRAQGISVEHFIRGLQQSPVPVRADQQESGVPRPPGQ